MCVCGGGGVGGNGVEVGVGGVELGGRSITQVEG